MGTEAQILLMIPPTLQLNSVLIMPVATLQAPVNKARGLGATEGGPANVFLTLLQKLKEKISGIFGQHDEHMKRGTEVLLELERGSTKRL